jgi:MYXO-CTERM domain-containing protein
MRAACLSLGLSVALPLLTWPTTANAGIDGGSLDSSTETSLPDADKEDGAGTGDSSGPVESSTDSSHGGEEIGIEAGFDGPVTRPDEDAKTDEDAGSGGASTASSGGGCSMSVPSDESGFWSLGLMVGAVGLAAAHARRRRSA